MICDYAHDKSAVPNSIQAHHVYLILTPWVGVLTPYIGIAWNTTDVEPAPCWFIPLLLSGV